MANRNHELDERIIHAAFSEFLEKGYREASLREIAKKAGVTVGAIQTRYKTKDELFCSLLAPFLFEIEKVFQSVKDEYHQEAAEGLIHHLEGSMKQESEVILHLIFDHYKEAVLLLCKSAGSSLEGFFDKIVERKVYESEAFFEEQKEKFFDENLLRLLISSQFYSYYQIVSGGYEREAAQGYMNAVMRYHFGGWTALLNTGKEMEGEEQL